MHLIGFTDLPKYSPVDELIVSLYHIIQTVTMLIQLCLKLLPCEAKQLAGDIAMHDADKVLKLVSVSLKLSNLQLI